MKKKIFILILVVVIFLAVILGCKQKTYENGVPTYFLEPDGYVIATVDLDDGLFGDFAYGYILNEDYQSYLDGTLSGLLIVKNPYTNGKEVSMSVDKIKYIEVGTYKDYRRYMK